MYFIPFPTPGHALPMADLARLFASRGADATLVLTRANAARLGGPVARAAAAGLRIRIIALTLPAEAAGLTGGHESADDLPNRIHRHGVLRALGAACSAAPQPTTE